MYIDNDVDAQILKSLGWELLGLVVTDTDLVEHYYRDGKWGKQIRGAPLGEYTWVPAKEIRAWGEFPSWYSSDSAAWKLLNLVLYSKDREVPRNFDIVCKRGEFVVSIGCGDGNRVGRPSDQLSCAICSAILELVATEPELLDRLDEHVDWREG